MALTTLERETIRKGAVSARILLDTLKPIADQLNVIYDSAGGAKTTITQADMDGESALSGLTKTQLDDAMFAITSTVKTAVDGAITQLSHLAARAPALGG